MKKYPNSDGCAGYGYIRTDSGNTSNTDPNTEGVVPNNFLNNGPISDTDRNAASILDGVFYINTDLDFFFDNLTVRAAQMFTFSPLLSTSPWTIHFDVTGSDQQDGNFLTPNRNMWLWNFSTNLWVQFDATKNVSGGVTTFEATVNPVDNYIQAGVAYLMIWDQSGAWAGFGQPEPKATSVMQTDLCWLDGFFRRGRRYRLWKTKV